MTENGGSLQYTLYLQSRLRDRVRGRNWGTDYAPTLPWRATKARSAAASALRVAAAGA